jgi:FkbM family methyltransferase
MSTRAISRIRQLMDYTVQSHLAPLVMHCDEAERVIGMLEDEASRDQYVRELVFNRMYFLLKRREEAVRFAGNISFEKWHEILEKTARMRASGEIPELAYPPAAEDWVLPHMYATAFVMEQYRHPRVEVPQGGVFLDCGACCGETAVWAVMKGAGTVHAFEPNPEALAFLRENAAKYGKGRIDIVPCGVGNERSTVGLGRSDAENIGSTKIREGGDEGIQVVTLDEWAQERSVVPDFIKMDLEGYEVRAIVGAQKLLVRHRPRLAIALYHSLEDYWNIPLLLKRIVPEYRFWCRKNEIYAEFVLYASV